MERPIKELTEDEIKEYRFIKAALDAGATVQKVSEGEGGVYLRGRKLSTAEVMDCIFNPDFKITMTNADRIRAMTDEELAKFFHDMIQDCGCNNVPCQRFCKAARNCELAWLNWLKKEARTND